MLLSRHGNTQQHCAMHAAAHVCKLMVFAPVSASVSLPAIYQNKCLSQLYLRYSLEHNDSFINPSRNSAFISTGDTPA